jgi:tetratricopeptide (TPR) repeat protein
MSLAWLLQFPPLLGLLAALIVVWFVARTTLLLFAEQRLAHGDDRRAGWLAQAALRLHPWSADALLVRARVLTRQGEHAAADCLLRRAVALDATQGDAEAALAAHLLTQGYTPSQALSISASPHVPPVSLALLHHRAHMALHVEADPAKAIGLLQAAHLDRLPVRTRCPLLLLLAEGYIAQGHCEEARATLKRIEEQLGTCARMQRAEALYHLGCLWKSLGEDGCRYFRQCVDLDPRGRYAQDAWRSAVTGE